MIVVINMNIKSGFYMNFWALAPLQSRNPGYSTDGSSFSLEIFIERSKDLNLCQNPTF
jgi:hypothetical protein